MEIVLKIQHRLEVISLLFWNKFEGVCVQYIAPEDVSITGEERRVPL